MNNIKEIVKEWFKKQPRIMKPDEENPGSYIITKSQKDKLLQKLSSLIGNQKTK